jgi:hypothetical protein
LTLDAREVIVPSPVDDAVELELELVVMVVKLELFESASPPFEVADGFVDTDVVASLTVADADGVVGPSRL